MNEKKVKSCRQTGNRISSAYVCRESGDSHEANGYNFQLFHKIVQAAYIESISTHKDINIYGWISRNTHMKEIMPDKIVLVVSQRIYSD